MAHNPQGCAPRHTMGIYNVGRKGKFQRPKSSRRIALRPASADYTLHSTRVPAPSTTPRTKPDSVYAPEGVPSKNAKNLLSSHAPSNPTWHPSIKSRALPLRPGPAYRGPTASGRVCRTFRGSSRQQIRPDKEHATCKCEEREMKEEPDGGRSSGIVEPSSYHALCPTANVLREPQLMAATSSSSTSSSITPGDRLACGSDANLMVLDRTSSWLGRSDMHGLPADKPSCC
ncbi:hypothetical protein VTK26DRAFT_5527 [Humicola hyalothermophila]